MKNNSIKNPMRKIKTQLIFTFFIFTFLTNLYAASIQCVWTGIEKIVAIGDIHGDYKNFVKILKGIKLINEELHWTGGKTHLVQTGDIMDRGPDAKKVFDLLIRLEKEAEEAGGKVHVLIGNHEEMNITGIAFDYVGYVTVDQFVSFLPDKYREKREKEFRERIGQKALKETDPDISLNINLEEFWREIMRNDGGARRKYINTFNEKYGIWILKHNAVIKINDIVFAHGGISEEFSKWKLEDINNLLRKELNFLRRAGRRSQPPKIPFKPEIVFDSNGPLWYRELAQKDEDVLKKEIGRILSNLDAKYMVIAHTPKRGKGVSMKDMRRFQGRIWIIDTGISDAYGGNLSALIIENGKFSVWGVNDEK
ncbi:MAG: metallophosphoesterase [Candidatus Aminicenantia bacterium]